MVVPWPENLGSWSGQNIWEFVDRVLERFEQKDLELSFKEQAQLKQVGTPIEYMLEFQRLSVKGDSMKMGNTFWPNLVMKTWFFTHVLDRSPRNAYIPYEFGLVVKKQTLEYYVGFPMIFKKNIFRCHLMCENSHLMNWVTLKFWRS